MTPQQQLRYETGKSQGRYFEVVFTDVCGCAVVALKPKPEGSNGLFGRPMTTFPCLAHDFSTGRPARLAEAGLTEESVEAWINSIYAKKAREH